MKRVWRSAGATSRCSARKSGIVSIFMDAVILVCDNGSCLIEFRRLAQFDYYEIAMRLYVFVVIVLHAAIRYLELPR
jgi:hypothetical protein